MPSNPINKWANELRRPFSRDEIKLGTVVSCLKNKNKSQKDGKQWPVNIGKTMFRLNSSQRNASQNYIEILSYSNPNGGHSGS